MSVYLPAGYGPWIHTRFPAKCQPQLARTTYRRADFPAYLWEPKALPFVAISFWGIVIVQSLSTLCVPNLLLKTICLCRGGGGGGGGGVRTRC